jgi:DNA-directed RNA polymerase subunit F
MELRAPPPIPDDWIKMNNLDVELIRVQEQRANELCDQLNRVEGYLSPAALWNRSDMLEKLTKTVSEFKAHINNKLVRVKSTNVEQLRTIFKRAGVKIIETLSMRKDVLERAAQHSKLTLERIVASTKNLWRKLVRADQHNTSKSIEKCKRTQ